MQSEQPPEIPPPHQPRLPLPHATELRQSDMVPPIPGGTDSSVRWRFPPIHPEGHRFGAIALVLTLIAVAFGWTTIAWLLGIVTVWVFSFFRDPQRSVPQDDRAIIAPADGMVTLIQTVKPPVEIMGEGLLPDQPMTRVSIFMSVFDVHINRTPIAGTVRSVVYIRGKFLNADLDKASEDNERQHILVERADGVRIGFTQIAGLVARRIVPFVKPGDIVAAGQRVGLIRFGSRVDVYLPAGTEPRVTLGQTTRAGETVIAMLGDSSAVRGVRY